ncbi:uncharacterized protein K452DRAFT_239886, partial [Aplosporella prunicola CBS 121167]
KASKQKIVTTSSTEAELLSLSHTAKETLYFDTGYKTAIQYDNQQTIRLLQEASLKLTTKLRHVDIYYH